MPKMRRVLSGALATVAITALVTAGATAAEAHPLPPVKLSKITNPPKP